MSATGELSIKLAVSLSKWNVVVVILFLTVTKVLKNAPLDEKCTNVCILHLTIHSAFTEMCSKKEDFI